LYNVVTRIRNVSLSLLQVSIQNNIDVMRPTVTTAHTLSVVVFNALNALWAVAGYNTVIPRLTSDPTNEFFG